MNVQMRLKNFNIQLGSQIFKALSDEARIRILHLIHQNKEMCISDLEHILEFTQTKTSRHITYLKNAGLIAPRKVDQWIFYSLKEETEDFITQAFSYLEKDPVLLKDMEIYKILYSNRELAENKIKLRVAGWSMSKRH